MHSSPYTGESDSLAARGGLLTAKYRIKLAPATQIPLGNLQTGRGQSKVGGECHGSQTTMGGADSGSLTVIAGWSVRVRFAYVYRLRSDMELKLIRRGGGGEHGSEKLPLHVAVEAERWVCPSTVGSVDTSFQTWVDGADLDLWT